MKQRRRRRTPLEEKIGRQVRAFGFVELWGFPFIVERKSVARIFQEDGWLLEDETVSGKIKKKG